MVAGGIIQICSYISNWACLDASLKISIKQCALRLCSFIQPGLVLFAIASVTVIHATHPGQAQDILKALFKVVGKKGIQDRVGTAVGVTQNHHKVPHGLQARSWHNQEGHG